MSAGYPLKSGRSIPLEDFKPEIEHRLTQLMLMPDDPQQKDCNWTELTLCLALRSVLRRCLETIETQEDSDGVHPITAKYNSAQGSLARTIAAGITEVLDDLPADLVKELDERIAAVKKARLKKE